MDFHKGEGMKTAVDKETFDGFVEALRKKGNYLGDVSENSSHTAHAIGIIGDTIIVAIAIGKDYFIDNHLLKEENKTLKEELSRKS